MKAPAHDPSMLPENVKELHVGKIVGYLRLLRRVRPNPNASNMVRKKWRVECIAPGCKSGAFTIPQNYLIRRPNPKTHCGCQARSLRTIQKREYRIWTMMRVRCNNPKHVAYKDYGGRGISVCLKWMDQETGFEEFFAYIGQAPTIKHTLDRKDVDGNYEPGNVRWATPIEQAQNTRKNKAKNAAQGNIS
jgi:hypothetical protein